MKNIKLFIAVLPMVFLLACTNENDTKRILEGEGFTNIQITGYDPFMCGEDDTYSTGFIAINKNGKEVKGTVCGGFMKGYTIRYK